MAGGTYTLPEGFRVRYELHPPFGVRKEKTGCFQHGKEGFDLIDLGTFGELLQELEHSDTGHWLHKEAVGRLDYELDTLFAQITDPVFMARYAGRDVTKPHVIAREIADIERRRDEYRWCPGYPRYPELLGYRNSDRPRPAMLDCLHPRDLVLIRLTPEAVSVFKPHQHDDSGMAILVQAAGEGREHVIEGIFEYGFVDWELGTSGVPVGHFGEPKYLKIAFTPKRFVKGGLADAYPRVFWSHLPAACLDGIAILESRIKQHIMIRIRKDKSEDVVERVVDLTAPIGPALYDLMKDLKLPYYHPGTIVAMGYALFLNGQRIWPGDSSLTFYSAGVRDGDTLEIRSLSPQRGIGE